MSAALTGKRALVTGASRGIGRGIAVRLAAEGALVAVHYGHDAAAAGETVAQIEAAGHRAFSIACDLNDFGAIGRMFDALDRDFAARGAQPGLDILVNNAAYRVSGPVATVTEEQFDAMFDINVKGLFFVTQRALERITDGGRIIHISSTAAQHARPRLVAYAASKGAVDSLTRSLAAAVAPRGITVNAVAPGTTETSAILAEMGTSEERKRGWVAQIALGRIGKPEDVAAVVAFLASPDGGWITGHVIPASGGTSL